MFGYLDWIFCCLFFFLSFDLLVVFFFYRYSEVDGFFFLFNVIFGICNVVVFIEILGFNENVKFYSFCSNCCFFVVYIDFFSLSEDENLND